MVGSPPLLALAFCAAIILGQLVEVAQSQSQNKTQPRTDPAEGVCVSLSLLVLGSWDSVLLVFAYRIFYFYFYFFILGDFIENR